MMAVLVMALGLSTSIIVMRRGFAGLDTARNLSYASQITQSEFERMRLLNWTTVSAYPSTPTTVAIPPSFQAIADVSTRFAMTRTATLVHAGMMQVTLTISWTNYDRRSFSRSYTTYYGQNGLYDYISL